MRTLTLEQRQTATETVGVPGLTLTPNGGTLSVHVDTHEGIEALLAKAMNTTDESAEYDHWFREQVQQALAEADDPNTVWVPHDIVKDDMQHQREVLQARIKSQASDFRPRGR